MLHVIIDINGRPIKSWKAVRIDGQEGEICTYIVNNKDTVKHHYNDGAVKLAQKIMKRKPIELED